MARIRRSSRRIRVQTLLQGVWKEIDEKVLPYIWDSSYPDAVQDVILRAVSLVSEADDELGRIGDTTSEVEDEYEQALEQGKLDGRLDVSALYVYIRDSETIARLVSAAETAGMQHYPDSSFVSERHLWLVRHCGFNSVSELDAFIKRIEPRALDVYDRLRELVEARTTSSVLLRRRAPWLNLFPTSGRRRRTRSRAT